MKKTTTILIVIILATLTTMPIKASDSVTDEERYHLSMYGNYIRDNISKEEYIDTNPFCKWTGICNCTQKYHLLNESTQNDFYSAFFNNEEFSYLPFEEIYQDTSSSMTSNFEYETEKIVKNISPILDEKKLEIKPVFENSKTNLYKFIGSFCNKENKFSPEKTIVIISDLWNTSKFEDEFEYSGNLVFCVPYESTNKEAVLHCEDVANNLILNHNKFGIGGMDIIDIYIVYMDQTIVKYSNGFFNGNDGYVDILVP